MLFKCTTCLHEQEGKETKQNEHPGPDCDSCGSSNMRPVYYKEN